MRHQTKRHKLGRTHAHRKATLASLSTALITHKRITTTLAKAKALRVYVEPLVNRAKEDSTHNRREVFRHLQSKEAVKELFSTVAESIGDRPGGYTRVVKLGERNGDGSEMAVIELVDFNDVRPEGAPETRRRRRTRRGGSATRKRAETAAEASTAAPATKAAPAPVVARETPEPEAEAPEPVSEAPAAPEETDTPEAVDQEDEETPTAAPEEEEPGEEKKEKE